MTEWSEARQLAAQYHSPGATGIGFAQFASTGTVTPELWANIRDIERQADEDYAEGWAGDMVHLRALLQRDDITEPAEVDTEFRAKDLIAALKSEGMTAMVQQTGGGTATFYVKDEADAEPWLIGPGSFNWNAPDESVFTTDELYYGPDSYDKDGEMKPEDPPFWEIAAGTSIPDAAKQIAAEYRKAKAN